VKLASWKKRLSEVSTFSLEKRAKKSLVNYFTRDRKGRKIQRKPPFGIHVTEVVPNQNMLALTLTLRAGHHYCCSSCGFSPPWGDLCWWLAHEGIEMNYPMRVRLQMTCERGALIAVDPTNLATCKPIEKGWSRDEYVIDESVVGPID
jgi:hypothetical protein